MKFTGVLGLVIGLVVSFWDINVDQWIRQNKMFLSYPTTPQAGVRSSVLPPLI